MCLAFLDLRLWHLQTIPGVVPEDDVARPLPHLRPGLARVARELGQRAPAWPVLPHGADLRRRFESLLLSAGASDTGTRADTARYIVQACEEQPQQASLAQAAQCLPVLTNITLHSSASRSLAREKACAKQAWLHSQCAAAQCPQHLPPQADAHLDEVIQRLALQRDGPAPGPHARPGQSFVV